MQVLPHASGMRGDVAGSAIPGQQSLLWNSIVWAGKL